MSVDPYLRDMDPRTIFRLDSDGRLVSLYEAACAASARVAWARRFGKEPEPYLVTLAKYKHWERKDVITWGENPFPRDADPRGIFRMSSSGRLVSLYEAAKAAKAQVTWARRLGKKPEPRLVVLATYAD